MNQFIQRVANYVANVSSGMVYLCVFGTALFSWNTKVACIT
jgi:hypothetical protein